MQLNRVFGGPWRKGEVAKANQAKGHTRLIRYEVPQGGNNWEERVTFLKSPDQLRLLIAELWSGTRAEFYDILSPAGDVLCLGLGNHAGCATYGTWLMVKEGRTMYAVGNEGAPEDETPAAAFLSGAGGEPTDVAPRYLLPLAELQRIAEHFFRTSDVPRDIPWD